MLISRQTVPPPQGASAIWAGVAGQEQSRSEMLSSPATGLREAGAGAAVELACRPASCCSAPLSRPRGWPGTGLPGGARRAWTSCWAFANRLLRSEADSSPCEAACPAAGPCCCPALPCAISLTACHQLECGGAGRGWSSGCTPSLPWSLLVAEHAAWLAPALVLDPVQGLSVRGTRTTLQSWTAMRFSRLCELPVY